MTPPAITTRVLLIEDRRAGSAARAVLPLRRYRLARLRSQVAAAASAGRSHHLKRG